METIIFVTLGLLVIAFLGLGYISPYFNNNKNIFQIQEPQIIEKEIIKEVEVIKEVPIEKEVIKFVYNEKELEEIKEWEEASLTDFQEWESEEETQDTTNELTLTEKKEILDTKWKNIGLELYRETNLEVFFEKLKSILNKKVLIVTDVSYVLEADFKDHRVFVGYFKDFEILDNTTEQPIIKFIVDIPVLNISIPLNWIYNKDKFDNDFSSEELVNNFLTTLKPVNELILVEE